MDNKALLTRISSLIDHFEQWRIPKLHKHEVNPGLEKWSRENYLYFTLPVSINFQRNSPAMWQSALKTREDKETNYLFFPEKVVETPIEKVRADLKRHKLWLQENKHTQIRSTLCQSLHMSFDNDPRKLLEQNEWSVSQITNFLIDNKKSYPYLNGPKMSHYWLFIMHHNTNIQLANREKLSIIPDTHIQQSSIKLWVTKEGDSPELVAQKRFELLEGTDIYPSDLHSMFWNRSRNNFQPFV